MNKFQFIRFAAVYSLKKKLPFIFRKPIHASIMVTYSCNSRCKCCFSWKNKNTAELSTAELKRTISDLKKEFGLIFLTFTGGEPFMRKDILKLIKFASDQGLLVNLTTNGTLINKMIINKLIDSGLYQLTISLDCINPSIYKQIRGVKKNFYKVMSNIDLINQQKRNFKLRIASIILKQNLSEILKLVEYSKNNGLQIIFQPFMPRYASDDIRNPYWYKNNELWPDPKESKEVINNLILFKKEGNPIINSIKYLKLLNQYFNNPNKQYKDLKSTCSRTIKILPEGRIKLCSYLSSIGNVKTEPLKDIWSSIDIKNYTKKKGMCNGCILQNCNFL